MLNVTLCVASDNRPPDALADAILKTALEQSPCQALLQAHSPDRCLCRLRIVAGAAGRVRRSSADNALRPEGG
jgi:hypothetical protein